MELVHDEQSETVKGREGKQDEVSEESETDEAWISILGCGGNVEIPHGTEMTASSVNMVHGSRNGEKEVESLQDWAILGYVGVNNAKAGILKNVDFPIAHGVYRKLK